MVDSKARALHDPFGRRFSYLRLSITDACNFSCRYCLPHGFKKTERDEPLSLEEIKNLVSGFAAMGTRKIRLTGGEPTLRRDFLKIVEAVSEVEGIDQVAVSTNGYRLLELAGTLKALGIEAVNVSVDSLDRDRFKQITGGGNLDEILKGLHEALKVGIPKVKVNAVLLKEHDELKSFLNWIRDIPVTVRFIELMPTGLNRAYFEENHLKAERLETELASLGWSERPRTEHDGPAREFSHPAYAGKIGLIAPYSKDFCQTCNRLRVTSRGGLRLCLFGEGNHELRDLLKASSQREELIARVFQLLNKKEISHYLPEGKFGNNHTFSAMGG